MSVLERKALAFRDKCKISMNLHAGLRQYERLQDVSSVLAR